MNYEQLIAVAPSTNPEKLKAALMAALSDIQKRLDNIELQHKIEANDHES